MRLGSGHEWTDNYSEVFIGPVHAVSMRDNNECHEPNKKITEDNSEILRTEALCTAFLCARDASLVWTKQLRFSSHLDRYDSSSLQSANTTTPVAKGIMEICK